MFLRRGPRDDGKGLLPSATVALGARAREQRWSRRVALPGGTAAGGLGFRSHEEGGQGKGSGPLEPLSGEWPGPLFQKTQVDRRGGSS